MKELPQPKNLAAWLTWLEQLHPSEIELGLGRVALVAAMLGFDITDASRQAAWLERDGSKPAAQATAHIPTCIPTYISIQTSLNTLGVDGAEAFGSRVAPQLVTVAGTNGKGSTIAVLEQILQDLGLSTAVYTSPHMLSFNERFRLGGRLASDDELCRAFAKIEQARDDVVLTFFEYTTLAAMLLFADQRVDVAIFEVGLGGRLDAVNIIPADLAIITSISLDHEQWLGNSRELIAAEKGGILHDGMAIICSDRDPPQSLLAIIDSLMLPHCFIGRDFDIRENAKGDISGEVVELGGEGWRQETANLPWQWLSHGSAMPLALAALPLPHSVLHKDSIAAAVAAASYLQPEADSQLISSAVARAQLRGRNQKIWLDGKLLWLDVAHNPAAVSYLTQNLRAANGAGRTLAVFAVMTDKRWQLMLDDINHVIDGWFLANLRGNPRAELPSVVRSYLLGKSDLQAGQLVRCLPSVEAALLAALADADIEDRIIVFGSFFTVADALSAIESGAGTIDG